MQHYSKPTILNKLAAAAKYLTVLLAVFSLYTGTVHAQNTDPYKALQTPFYDPNDGEGTSTTTCADPAANDSTPLTGDSNTQKAWNYFIGKGLTPIQTAAILGNFQAESGIEPRKVQGGALSQTNPLDGNTGYGIAQWTDIGRQKNLQAFADADPAKRPVYSLELQLDFVMHETEGAGGVMATMKSIQNLSPAVDYWMNTYEKPYVRNGTTRLGFATDILTANGSGTTTGPATPPTATCDTGPGGQPVTAPTGTSTELSLQLLQKHYKGTINGHTYNGDGKLTCQGGNCNDLDNTAHGVSIKNNGGQCASTELAPDLLKGLTVIIEQGGFSLGLSALCNDHPVTSSTGAPQSRHNVGEAADINFVNKIWMCSATAEPGVLALLKYVNSTIGTSVAPDQLLNQGVAAGSGCSASANYIAANDDLSMNDHKNAPKFTSAYVGDHQNHVHIGY